MSQSISNNVNSFNTFSFNVPNFTADDHRSNILSWLSPLDPRLRHQGIRDRQVEKIGEWVLETEEFRSWYAGNGESESDNAVLVCYGNPGAGKTFISSLVIDKLCDQARELNVAVAYFYLDFAAHSEQSPANILGALLKQAVSELDDVPGEIVEVYKNQKRPTGGRVPSLSDIVKMLRAVSSEKRTFICIDALDECVAEDRAKLLNSLNRILHQSPPQLPPETRIFVTGRPHIEAEVGKRLPGRVTTIHIIPRRNDVITYLRSKLDDDPTPDAMDSSLETDILEKIPQDVSEIFHLVSLNIDAILQEPTIYRRRKRLSAMTNGLGLGDVYDATLDRIKRQGGEKARLGMDTLMWISHSERALTVDELCNALAVEIGSPDLIFDNVPTIRTLLACCQGLVVTDKEGVRLFHVTLQEYLQDHPKLFVSAHSTMAETCLSFLNSQQVIALSDSPSPDPQRTPFLEYSSLYWGVHAKRKLSDRAKSLALKLFDHYNSHISVKIFLKEQKSDLPIVDFHNLPPFSGLHYASAFGIDKLAATLVEVEGCNINQTDTIGNTPLWWAIRNRHEKLVEVLVGRSDLDPNKPDHDGKTPLHYAVENELEGVVKILLERSDVNPNERDHGGQTPLYRATRSGYEGVVKILLEWRDVNSKKLHNNNNPPPTPETLKNFPQPNTPRGMVASSRMFATSRQHLIPGNISGDSSNSNVMGSFHTCIANNSSSSPSVPATLEELVTDNRWGVSPPEIDLDYLCDPYNLLQDGTGEWVFKDDGYKKWQDSEESQLLWLCGGPGTGKTMLAKRVAAKFLEGHRDPDRGGIFSCHFVSPELPTDGVPPGGAESSQHRLAKVPWDLLYGILQQNGNLFDVCKDELRTQGDKLFTNPGSLWKVLRKAIQACGPNPVYILIDGVDGFKESSSRGFVDRILGLMTIPGVKIFFSSRDSPYISSNLSECIKINLDGNTFVRKDVNTFVRRRVIAFRNWEVDQKDRAIKSLLEKSEGTFLWASLAVENLKRSITGPDLEDLPEEFPLELKDVYRKMLCDVDSREGSEKVLEMIRNVALALRPLTFGEFGHILACIEETRTSQRPSRKGKNPESRPRKEEEIKQYVRSSMGFLRVGDTTVSIVHHTATEYLFDKELQDSLQVPTKGELDLTASWECFRYLHSAFEDLEKPSDGNDRGRHNTSQKSNSQSDRQEKQEEVPSEVARRCPQEAVAKWPYLKYAAESWFIHARRSIEIADHELWGNSAPNWLERQFFDTRDVIRKPWIKLCGDPRMEVLAGDQTPLHVAVCLGLRPLVEKALLDSNAGARGTSNNQPPLSLAAKLMSKASKILRGESNSSPLTALERDSITPPHEAATSSHKPTLVGPVGKFATPRYRVHSDKIDKQNSSGNTPLHLAILFDHPDIVKFLVENHADLTIKNHQGTTALELEQAEDIRQSVGGVVVETMVEGTEETRQEAREEPRKGFRRRLWKKL
ncbi:hypothetical protein HOY82DRAFT_639180 [Tuber indicum]|nr:hypothetical protein HOY82DRAFT_639180 [Tuber indicum]